MMSSTSNNNNDNRSSTDGQHPSTEDVVDAVVKNGFIIPVKLQFQSSSSTTTTPLPQQQEEATKTMVYYLTPCTTVTDLKWMISRRHGIEPQNQRLGLVLGDNGGGGGGGGGGNDGGDGGGAGREGEGEGVRRRRPIFYGRFLLDSTKQSATVSVEDVPVDPTWQGFYDMTGYDDWKERDQITQSMYSGRRARHCPEGYPLRVGTHTRLPCVKCGFIYDPESETMIRRNGELFAVVPMVSKTFNHDSNGDGVDVDVDNHDDPPPFVLCILCYERDTDTPVDLTTTADPYRLILRLAVDLGQRLTSSSARRGHWIGYPTVSFHPSLVEFSNKKMRSKPTEPERRRGTVRYVGMDVTGSNDLVVVPAGVRVVVKLNDRQRQAVIDAGHGDKLSSVEVDDDENRQNPLSSCDVIAFRESINRRNNEDVSDAIQKFMHWDEPWIGGRDLRFDPYLKLVTYEVDQVVFELYIMYTDDGDY